MLRPSRAARLSVALFASLLFAGAAHAQVFSARRMAMGGVVLRGGSGLTGANVAYKAVPPEPSTGRHIPLPLGLLQLAENPPVFDAKNPDFNAFALADLLYELPWNYRLGATPAPSSDISISVARNSLAIDLGGVGAVIPKDGTKLSLIATDPSVSFGLGHALSVGVAPIIHYQTDFTLNPTLYQALANGEAFVPNTDYEASGNAVSQAAVGLDVAYATRLLSSGDDPRASGGMAIYAGARAKLLRGLLYDDANGSAGFRTPDTLFGGTGDSVAFKYDAIYRTAGPSDGGMGYGLDLGAVCLFGPLEVGLGVNDVRTQLHWHMREAEVSRDSAGNQIENTLATNQSFTSTVPTTATANVIARLGTLTLAADAVRGPLAWTAHAGAEQQMGMLAFRGGLAIDENQLIQYSGGTGVRLGPVGLDLAVATNSQNLSRVRVLELGAGLTLY